MNMVNIFLLPWRLSSKLPCKMFNTVYTGCVLTLENFLHQGQVRGDLTARRQYQSKPRPHPKACVQAKEFDSSPWALSELGLWLQLVPGLIVWSVPSRMGHQQLPITKGLVQRQMPRLHSRGNWKGHCSWSDAESWDMAWGVLFIIRTSFASQPL